MEAALALLVLAGLGLSGSAEARVISVDSGGWTVPSSNPTGQLGFSFNFFGVETTEVDIGQDGRVSFGGATISPFFSDIHDLGFTWQNTADAPPLEPGEEPAFPAGSGIDAGFRVCWGCFSGETEFQLAIFDLGGGQFAMEFNYARLPEEDSAFIGYDNGQGVSFDMLAALGLNSPEKWAGFSENDFEENICPVDSQQETALACNNYDFSSDSDNLRSDYGGYFQRGGEPVLSGRYLFFLTAQTADVPEPGAGILILTGLAALGAIRRRVTKHR